MLLNDSNDAPPNVGTSYIVVDSK